MRYESFNHTSAICMVYTYQHVYIHTACNYYIHTYQHLNNIKLVITICICMHTHTYSNIQIYHHIGSIDDHLSCCILILGAHSAQVISNPVSALRITSTVKSKFCKSICHLRILAVFTGFPFKMVSASQTVCKVNLVPYKYS